MDNMDTEMDVYTCEKHGHAGSEPCVRCFLSIGKLDAAVTGVKWVTCDRPSMTPPVPSFDYQQQEEEALMCYYSPPPRLEPPTSDEFQWERWGTPSDLVCSERVE
ncbi:MAG: hypothetical protein CMK92_00425 [Pseudomonas sp.]|nr:hypothetical protein [Pseudomonas sp.]